MENNIQSPQPNDDQDLTIPCITQARRWTMGAKESHLATVRCYYNLSDHYEGGGYWRVTDVWVDPAHRGKGWATALMRAMLEVMRFDDLYLRAQPFDYETSPVLSIDQLIAWYEKFGFRSIPTAPDNMIRRADARQTIRSTGGPVNHRKLSDPLPANAPIMIDGKTIYSHHRHYQGLRSLVDHNRRMYDEIRSKMPADHVCNMATMILDRFTNVVRCGVCLDTPDQNGDMANQVRVHAGMQDRLNAIVDTMIQNDLKYCDYIGCDQLIPAHFDQCPKCGWPKIGDQALNAGRWKNRP